MDCLCYAYFYLSGFGVQVLEFILNFVRFLDITFN